jgi:DNA topoisomerase-3
METAGRQLTDKELARALRGAGLGTPATRASILQTLINRGYVLREKKALLSTNKGRELIRACPVQALKSAELTGRWEGRLTQMAEGKQPRAAFMAAVREATTEMIDAIRLAPAPDVEPDAPRFEQGKAVGDCPACGKPVRKRKSVWSCDTGRACPFVVFETMAKRKISARMVKLVLTDGKTPVVKGFKSKAGKTFDAGLMWDSEKQKVSFYFDNSNRRGPSAEAGMATSGSPEGHGCPACGIGTIIRGRRSFGCSRWREGCGYRTS